MRTAWPMRCSFSMSANRTWPSPPGPNPTPGEVATSASDTRNDGELERAHLAVGLGDGRPHEHGPLGGRQVPPDAVEPVAQRVAPGQVGLVDPLRVVGHLVHGHDGGDLDGLEGAVVEVALELGERGDDLGVAHQERHPPPRHRERLGERVQLDGHVLGPGDLQDRRRLVAVEGDVGIGEVVHEDDVVLTGEVDDALHPGQVDTRRGGVVGERQHDDARLGPGRLPRLHEVVEEGLGRRRARRCWWPAPGAPGGPRRRRRAGRRCGSGTTATARARCRRGRAAPT